MDVIPQEETPFIIKMKEKALYNAIVEALIENEEKVSDSKTIGIRISKCFRGDILKGQHNHVLIMKPKTGDLKLVIGYATFYIFLKTVLETEKASKDLIEYIYSDFHPVWHELFQAAA